MEGFYKWTKTEIAINVDKRKLEIEKEPTDK